MAVFTGRNTTIRKILTIGYGVYRSTHNLPAHIERAVYDQLSCRTKHRGKHSEYCPDGHYVRSHYNSCHNRTCPQCSSLQLERWLKKQEAHLIACDHYHAIFTIAHEFNGIWMNNKKVMTSILFITARDTVFKLLVTGKYLKALPGIIGSLHTWTKTQLLHPHVHFLITGGGITPEGDRHPSKNGFLLSVKLAMKIFRTTFRWRVRKSYRKGELKLPPEITRKEFAKMLVETGRKKWNVYIEEKYSHGKGVLKYIVRYLKGGSISNQRVLKITDTKVTISYKDSKDRESNGKSKKKKMILLLGEFIHRYLLHVPWPRAQHVRYYGIYSKNKKDILNKCRSISGQPPVEEPEFLDWETYLSQMGHKIPTLCPVCGKELIKESQIELRSNYPPIGELLKKAA